MEKPASRAVERDQPNRHYTTQDINLTDVWAMLQFISPHDRDDWISIGMALKSEFSGDAFSLFDEWSQTADNYDPKAARAVWRSFKGHGKTIATLIHLAKQNGYSNYTGSPPPPMVIPKRDPPKESNFDTRAYGIKLFEASNTDDDFVAGHQYAIASDIFHAAGAGRGFASGSLIGKKADCIIVPCRDIKTDNLIAVQCINGVGKKQTFGGIKGGALILGNSLDLKTPWYVLEGWASAVLMLTHHLKGSAVCIVSFGKALQRETAELINRRYNPDSVVILAEVD